MSAAAATSAATSAAASPPPLSNEFTVAFPRFAKAKGLLATPFRVQNHAFTMYVFTGAFPAAAAVNNNNTNVPYAASILLKCTDGNVACFVVNTSDAPVNYSLRINGGGRIPTTSLYGTLRPGGRSNMPRYVTRDKALEAAKDNGGCLAITVAMDVTPLADNDHVHRFDNDGHHFHLRFLPNTITGGHRDLRNDLLSANDGVSGDFQVVVRAATEVIIQTHKFILAARSPVLRAMLASTMTEASSGRMEMVGNSVGAVHGFIRFLHSDTCEEETLVAHGWELLEMADKYDVSALRCVCESWLGGRISAANAIETLQRADSNNAPTLKRKAIEYVAANKKTALGGNSQAALRELGADLLSEVVFAIAD
jgi:hypothetical protein